MNPKNQINQTNQINQSPPRIAVVGAGCGPSMVFTNVMNPRSEIPRMHEHKNTLIKRGVTFGANCTILCGTTIGRYAFIGAGAVVTKDVPDHALVTGNPARVAGWMCECGVKLKGGKGVVRCLSCGKQYTRKGKGVVLR